MNKYTYTYNVILDNMDLMWYRLKPLDAIMYLQDSFARYCATKKVAAYDLFPKNLYWVISDFNIEFTDDTPFWSEEIETEIWFSEISKLRTYTDFVIKHRGNVFAKGNICWFILDQNTHRPTKIDELLAHCEVLPELTLGEHTKFQLEEPKEKIGEIVHRMSLSDVDFNSHVNNKSYINIAAMSDSLEFRKTHTLKNLKVKFIRESYLDDVLVCNTFSTDTPNTHIYKLEKDGVPVCEVGTSWSDDVNDMNILDYDLDVKHS